MSLIALVFILFLRCCLTDVLAKCQGENNYLVAPLCPLQLPCAASVSLPSFFFLSLKCQSLRVWYRFSEALCLPLWLISLPLTGNGEHPRSCHSLQDKVCTFSDLLKITDKALYFSHGSQLHWGHSEWNLEREHPEPEGT